MFAWSDLHLENRSNFELIKQFCKVHCRRPASPARSSKIDCDDSDMSFSSSDASNDYHHLRSTAYGSEHALPDGNNRLLRGTSLVENIGKIWETLKGSQAPLNEDFSQDVLILAGDVHNDMEGLKQSLELFRSVFGHVAFVPGNHELWIIQKDRDSGIGDSLQKLDRILLLCDLLGVHTRPFNPFKGVRIVPLLSWYDEFDPQFCRAAMSSPPAAYRLPMGAKSVPTSSGNGIFPPFGNRGSYDRRMLLSLAENWMDYSACKWPHPLSNNDPRAGGGQRLQHSYYVRREPEMILSGRLNAIRLGGNGKCTGREAKPSSATPPSIVVIPPSPVQVGCEEQTTVTGCGGDSNTFSESSCYMWSVEKAKEAARTLLPSCSSRRTTDALGMPLSLADLFALENERRGSFAQETPMKSAELRQPQRNEFDISTAFSSARSHDVAINNESQTPKKQVLQNDPGSQPASAGAHLASASKGIPTPASLHSDENPLVITFSHFLPRAELATIYPLTPSALAYVMGSNRIDEQLRQAKSSMHVFGHSHINGDIEIEGVRYIQHSLGRPSEQKWFPGRRKPKVIYEVSS